MPPVKHILDEDDIPLEDLEFNNEINHNPMEDVHDDAPEDWFDDEAQEDEDTSKSKKKGNTEKLLGFLSPVTVRSFAIFGQDRDWSKIFIMQNGRDRDWLTGLALDWLQL